MPSASAGGDPDPRGICGFLTILANCVGVGSRRKVEPKNEARRGRLQTCTSLVGHKFG